MMNNKTEKNEKIEFKDFFRFTKNGKMKSGTVVYSFSLAVLFLVVYGAAYYFLIDVLAPMTEGLPIWLSDLVGAVVPAAAGALVCLVPELMISEKKLALWAYLWNAAFALMFFAAMLIQLKNEPEALSIFVRLFLIMVPAPMIIGGGIAWWIWRKNQ